MCQIQKANITGVYSKYILLADDTIQDACFGHASHRIHQWCYFSEGDILWFDFLPTNNKYDELMNSFLIFLFQLLIWTMYNITAFCGLLTQAKWPKWQWSVQNVVSHEVKRWYLKYKSRISSEIRPCDDTILGRICYIAKLTKLTFDQTRRSYLHLP